MVKEAAPVQPTCAADAPIQIDLETLLNAHRDDQPGHADALHTIEALAASGKPWGVPLAVTTNFLKVATHPEVLTPPTTSEAAVAFVHKLLQRPGCDLIMP